MMKAMVLCPFILVVLVSCNGLRSRNIEESTVDNEPDTTKPQIVTSFKDTTYPVIFEAAFVAKTRVLNGEMLYDFAPQDIGNIRIESGRIVGSDLAFIKNGSTPFAATFPIGEFPVQMAMAQTTNDRRVAFCRIVFSNKPVSRWEYALRKGQLPISAKDTSYDCYPVDSGCGMFIDSLTGDLYDKFSETRQEAVFAGLGEDIDRRGYLHVFDGHNFAAFTTGYGDGCYVSYVGYDHEGKICRLLTDFELVGWWKIPQTRQ